MKISEGIRLGSAGKKQIRDAWYTPDKKGVCAIGALMLVGQSSGVYEDFPNLQDRLSNNNFLITEIISRNSCGDTFEQIAAWLESIGQ